MAKVGYIYCTSHDDSLAEVKAWMSDYGCVQIVEEETAQEKLRPQWKQLLANLDRGDELVVSKFSNAVQGLRQLIGTVHCAVEDEDRARRNFLFHQVS